MTDESEEESSEDEWVENDDIEETTKKRADEQWKTAERAGCHKGHKLDKAELEDPFGDADGEEFGGDQ